MAWGKGYLIWCACPGHALPNANMERAELLSFRRHSQSCRFCRLLFRVKRLEDKCTYRSWKEARNPARGKAVTTCSFFYSLSGQQIARFYQDCPRSSATQSLAVRWEANLKFLCRRQALENLSVLSGWPWIFISLFKRLQSQFETGICSRGNSSWDPREEPAEETLPCSALVIGASKQLCIQNKPKITLQHTSSMAFHLQLFDLAE